MCVSHPCAKFARAVPHLPSHPSKPPATATRHSHPSKPPATTTHHIHQTQPPDTSTRRNRSPQHGCAASLSQAHMKLRSRNQRCGQQSLEAPPPPEEQPRKRERIDGATRSRHSWFLTRCDDNTRIHPRGLLLRLGAGSNRIHHLWLLARFAFLAAGRARQMCAREAEICQEYLQSYFISFCPPCPHPGQS
jgi:hypothetical protein